MPGDIRGSTVPASASELTPARAKVKADPEFSPEQAQVNTLRKTYDDITAKVTAANVPGKEGEFATLRAQKTQAFKAWNEANEKIVQASKPAARTRDEARFR